VCIAGESMMIPLQQSKQRSLKMELQSRSVATINQISNIMNKKRFIGAYIGIKNSYKIAEVNVYTNKNDNGFHFVMIIFNNDKTDYKQGVLMNALYLNSLTDTLGKKYESFQNQEALKEYWNDLGLELDNVLNINI
jgi:hypothetical protein